MIHGRTITKNHWLVVKEDGITQYVCTRQDYGSSKSYDRSKRNAAGVCHCPVCKDPLSSQIGVWGDHWVMMPRNSIRKTNCRKCNAALVMVHE